MTQSAFFNKSVRMALPSSDFKSSAIPRLFRFIIKNAADSSPTCGGTMRLESSPPSIFSTLMTSAPISASIMPQSGPAIMCASSITRMPDSGFGRSLIARANSLFVSRKMHQFLQQSPRLNNTAELNQHHQESNDLTDAITLLWSLTQLRVPVSSNDAQVLGRAHHKIQNHPTLHSQSLNQSTAVDRETRLLTTDTVYETHQVNEPVD